MDSHVARRWAPQAITRERITDPDILEAAALGKFPIYEHNAASGRTIYRAPQHALEFVQRYVGEQQLAPHRVHERIDFLEGSPFQFFRGLPALFVADVRGGPYRELMQFHPDKPPAPRVLINGDSHIGNFGVFQGHDGKVVFGSNDHDQSGHGTPEEDVARLAVSVVLQARALGFSEKEQRFFAKETVDGYTDEIRAIAKAGVRPPYLTLDELKGGKSKKRRTARRDENDLVLNLITGNKKRQAKFHNKYMWQTDEGWRLRVDPDREGDNPTAEGYHRKLWPVTGEHAEWVEALSTAAIVRPGGGIEFPLVMLDAAEKRLSGGSTIGLPRFYGLFAAKDPNMPPIVLEVKQLLPCSAQTLSGNPSHADGQGVLDRQRDAEQDFNPLTGAVVLTDSSHYLVREREPEKDSIDFAKTQVTIEQLLQYARDSAAVRARQHARTEKLAEELSAWIGDKNEDDEAEQRVGDFAFQYADQTYEDFIVFSSSPKEFSHQR